jgi:hypothetical protein
MFANIVNLHVKLVLQCFVTPATQILEIHVQDVKKQILWKKSSYFLYLRIYFLIL